LLSTPETNRTPPVARTENSLVVVETKSTSVESAQTNVPACRAFALRPAAKENTPLAALLLPPGMVANQELGATTLFMPPEIVAKIALVWIMFAHPPPIIE